MGLKWTILIVLQITTVFAQQRATVRNLQARYDAQQDAIFVTWSSPEQGRTGL
jgi:predicted Holliday junction resolvase-like endonuclease